MRLASLAALTLMASLAAADPPAPTSSSDEAPRLAAAVNFPLMWNHSESIAGSLYFGIASDAALRLNVASYRTHGSTLGGLFALAQGEDGDEALRTGRHLDLGAAYTHYSRRLWDGFTWEVGLLVRSTDIRVEDEFARVDLVSTDTTTYAARFHVGWSWLLGNHVFIATAVGLSIGYERGKETKDVSTFDEMPPYQLHVSRDAASGEAYLRFGIAN